MFAIRLALSLSVAVLCVAALPVAGAEQPPSSAIVVNPYFAAQERSVPGGNSQLSATAERTHRLPADGLAALRAAVRVSSIAAAVPATNDAERANGVQRRALAAAELRVQAAASQRAPQMTTAALAPPLGRTIVDSQVQAASWTVETADTDAANPLRRFHAPQASIAPTGDAAANPLR